MESFKKIFNKNIISYEDLYFLNALLKTDLPIINCFDLLKTKKNKNIYENIINELNKGNSINNVIVNYLDDGIKIYLFPLIKILTFSESLDISLSFIDNYKKIKEETIKALSYPLIILCISIVSIYLFDLYGLDTIISLIESFTSDLGLFKTIRLIFRICINLMLIILVIIGLFILYFLKGNHILYFYILISKYLPQSIFHLYYTLEFVSLLSLTIEKGYKSKEALSILKSIKERKIISFIAYHLDEELLEGKSLNEASKINYLDKHLSRFIKIASYSNDFLTYLKSYEDIHKKKFIKQIKNLTLAIQLSTYFIIGIIIIFIYQILFMPMQAINGF